MPLFRKKPVVIEASCPHGYTNFPCPVCTPAFFSSLAARSGKPPPPNDAPAAGTSAPSVTEPSGEPRAATGQSLPDRDDVRAQRVTDACPEAHNDGRAFVTVCIQCYEREKRRADVEVAERNRQWEKRKAAEARAFWAEGALRALLSSSLLNREAPAVVSALDVLAKAEGQSAAQPPPSSPKENP